MYKILQINVVGNWGSTGRIANDIGDMCISNGWKSYIGTGRKIRESKSEIIKIQAIHYIYIPHNCLHDFTI